MAAAFGAILATILTLDIPWVTINKTYGVYKGKVNGSVTCPYRVAAIWLIIACLEAGALTYVVQRAESHTMAILHGAFLGLTVYWTFNGTSLATFPNWGWKTALVDTVWGSVLLGTASVVGYTVYKAVAERNDRSPE